MEKTMNEPMVVNNVITAPGYYFKEILTIEDASEYIGVTVGSIYQYVNKKQIPYYKPSGEKGRSYFKKSELNDFMLRNKILANYEVSDKADAKLNGEA
jgi:excisionase family DNA binding protein